mmetsp:Transcript_11749/g.15941  ORF Transcript_11749/g.15941 Transcript_11749/m.15941 type:complete len:273 (-) Transcript_11749:1552-2370(-)|eukprot:CAMPEP_0197301578 /NCGR_PEP_ID=MMETSP0890-20130614/50492_1 /TAXON_ID=44058 ORGANISM="Aureoumbra lagunensis, Strain CCMP1510" /NCGR_SAMPLE_ID=MMETSP0890 /ASSEMBLY_ACC=CAM_ASM_000533 /LENGTH=272 /DNA_ID=CAMNT_0042780923 /DNA_START=136 /DNA_END=954 /DNA_ORIENTATION=-
MGAPSKAPLKPRMFVAACFSMIAGYGDIITFIRYNEFAGMQTGNMILMGMKFIDEKTIHVVFNIAVMAANMGGVLGISLMKDMKPSFYARWSGPIVASVVLVGDLMDFLLGSNKWHTCFLAASLGAMNYMGFSGKVGAMTALATGNLQKCAKGIYCILRAKPLGADRDATLVALIVVLGTILGSTLGASALKWEPFGHHFLLTPVAITQLIAFTVHDTAFQERTSSIDGSPLLQFDSTTVNGGHESTSDDASFSSGQAPPPRVSSGGRPSEV